jgi:ferredoxin
MIRGMSTSSTLTWLKSKGYGDDVALGIMKAFPNTPTVPEIQAMGDAGLKALAEAVAKDVKKLENAVDVHIVVKIPHENKVLHITGKEGESLYDLTTKEPELAQSLECACRGIAACSTCHVYVAKKFREKLPPPEENELDMLDLAWGVKKSSRLGCQIKLSKEVEGLTVKIPAQANNLFN